MDLMGMNKQQTLQASFKTTGTPFWMKHMASEMANSQLSNGPREKPLADIKYEILIGSYEPC